MLRFDDHDHEHGLQVLVRETVPIPQVVVVDVMGECGTKTEKRENSGKGHFGDFSDALLRPRASLTVENCKLRRGSKIDWSESLFGQCTRL